MSAQTQARFAKFAQSALKALSEFHRKQINNYNNKSTFVVVNRVFGGFTVSQNVALSEQKRSYPSDRGLRDYAAVVDTILMDRI